MIVIDWRSFKLHWEKPPKKQFPMGLRVYIAPQGGGKTLSLVHDLFDLKREYPEAIVLSDIELKGIDYVKWRGMTGLKKALKINNGDKGVILVCDEMQLFASKKEGVPYEVFQRLCQQRKNRRFMLGTAQDWEDVDVSSRKKVKEVVKCRTIFKKIQINTYFDGYSIKWDKKENEWSCKQIGIKIFKHNNSLYNCYNTFEEVTTNEEMVSGVDGQRRVDLQNSINEDAARRGVYRTTGRK